MTEDDRIDLSRVKTYPLAERRNKVHVAHLARPLEPDCSFQEFLARLPDLLAVKDFRRVVEAIVEARLKKRVVAVALGAHVIKVGLSPILIDLMRRGLITSVALNGGGSIHDFELALIGQTSEDVQQGLSDGRFGMAEETGSLMNKAVTAAWRCEGTDSPHGMGELLGRQLIALDAPYRQHSILVAGIELGVPVTVHVAVGADIIHMHPDAHGAAIGQAAFNDFHRYTAALTQLGRGGVYLNIGSAVILPEVFLKALTILRNLGHDVVDFVAVNLDRQQHYRPLENVVRRPTCGHEPGYALTGHHELLVPLLAQAVIEEAARRQPAGRAFEEDNGESRAAE